MTDDPDRDTIEGKRLIRAAGPPGDSLAGRVDEWLQRLSWRTPLHAMRLKGRHPLKLIAVPDDPLIGDARRGHALLAGSVAIRGESRAIVSLAASRAQWSATFADYWHGFAWLRDLSTVATRAEAVPIAEMLMAMWLTAHADRVDAAWRPDLWGRRILFWTAHAPLILSSADLVYRSKVLNTIARGARHLDRGADRVPAGPARVASWCGVVAAGLLIPGGEARQATGEAGLARALAGATTADGGATSRSPADLADLLMLLAMLAETYAARRLPLPTMLAEALAHGVPALLGTAAADGGLGSWQGAAPMPAAAVADLVAATGVAAPPLRQPGDWGYQRLSGGTAVLVVDAAPPPIGRACGGCASTLAFELSDGATRLVVNCGGANQAVAALPAAVARGLRSTAAHSTLTLADTNSTALHPDGQLGRGVAEVEVARQESDHASRIDAGHDGYVRRFGLRHRRQLTLAADGRELRGEDALVPAGKERRAATGYAIRFHLGAGVEASPTADGVAALLRLPGGALWQFRCRGAALAIEESLWIDGDGRPVATQQLVVSGEAAMSGVTVNWTLRRAM